ncbi:MAG: DUF494 family protein [Caldithrix sp.]|nr:MAG: DUF494 family protein [Caldithrix sp.]
MNERVVEILIYIMSEIRRNRSVSKKLDFLSENLIKKGYSESEITSAFTWLLDRLNSETEELIERRGAALKNSRRHLHEIERSVISVEAYGYIIQLRELGIVNDVDVEQILERALMLGTGRVRVEDVKGIVGSMLFSPEGAAAGGYFLVDDNTMIH